MDEWNAVQQNVAWRQWHMAVELAKLCHCNRCVYTTMPNSMMNDIGGTLVTAPSVDNATASSSEYGPTIVTTPYRAHA